MAFSFSLMRDDKTKTKQKNLLQQNQKRDVLKKEKKKIMIFVRFILVFVLYFILFLILFILQKMKKKKNNVKTTLNDKFLFLQIVKKSVFPFPVKKISI